MKKLYALMLFALLLVAAPASAAPGQLVGQRINVYLGTPTTFPANTPFHINHGWGLGATMHPVANGIFGFTLDVDGAPRDADLVFRSTDPAPATGYEYPVLSRS